MHRNSYDIVRLVAALSVIYSHQYGVTGVSGGLAFQGAGLGTWGVIVFFGLSGYLNTLSLVKSRSVLTFAVRRAARLYPGLIVCMTFCVLLGAAVTTVPQAEYWVRQTWDFFYRNSGLFFGVRQYLPGVFDTTPSEGVNVSIWTLPIEAKCYLYFGILFWLSRYQPIAALAAACIGLAFLFWNAPLSIVADQVTMFKVAFAVGVAFAAGEIVFGFRQIVLILGAISAALLVAAHVGATSVLLCVIAAIAVGRQESVQLPLDISYGLYLYSFPVQQLMVWMGFGFVGSAIASLLTVTALAIASAIFVERPALLRSHQFRPPKWMRERTRSQEAPTST